MTSPLSLLLPVTPSPTDSTHQEQLTNVNLPKSISRLTPTPPEWPRPFPAGSAPSSSQEPPSDLSIKLYSEDPLLTASLAPVDILSDC